MKTQYFESCSSLDEVKRKYKELAMKYHPDRGGSKEIMQEINSQYESIRKNPLFRFDKVNKDARKDYVEFPEIINHIIGFKGIVIELCGNWLWISGQTYQYRWQLKKYGFLFADQKKLWYWRPNDYKSANQEPKSMEYIRSKYGSDVYPTAQIPELETADIPKK
jgi:curved DNA-binding protein CbpA